MKNESKTFKSAFTKSKIKVDMSGSSTTFDITNPEVMKRTNTIGLSNKDAIELANYILRVQTDKFLLEE